MFCTFSLSVDTVSKDVFLLLHKHPGLEVCV
jgi:hypothetical protein